MKQREKLAKESAEYLAEAFESRLTPDAIYSNGDFKPEYLELLALFAENTYEEGFRKAREMAAETLGPPWPHAILTIPSGNITWDRDGMRLIQQEILKLGESEVGE